MPAAWEVLVQKARDIRDNSLLEVDKYFPLPAGYESGHLTGEIPDPLPIDVTGFPKKYLHPDDFAIVSRDPSILLDQLTSGKIKAVAVAAAFLRCAVLAQRSVNCVTQFLPERAYKTAKAADDYFAKHGKPLGRLHGLPISLKDKVDVAGGYSNYGCAALVENLRENDSLIVQILEKEGAVFYQRTTQPLFLMHMETNSNLYGVTVNPHNTKLTPGGSSGGEAASIAFGSAIVGLGTDIGGSIRGPSAFSGRNFSEECERAGSGPAVGWKPTSNLLPLSDCFNPSPGAEAIPGVIGPMARTFEIAELVNRVIVDAKPYKVLPELTNKPWDADVYKGIKKLRIGILADDGIVLPQPPIKRAVDEVRAKLQSVGSIDGIKIEVVEFEPYKHEVALELSPLFFEDAALSKKELLDKVGEPFAPLSEGSFIMMNRFCAQNTKKPIEDGITIKGLWELNTKKNKWRKEYLDHFHKSGVDLIIAPAHAGTAQPLYKTTYTGYTFFLNFLDWPALAFQVGKQDPSIDVKYDIPDYKPRNKFDKDYFYQYDPELFKGAPTGLQIAAPRSENEQVIEGFRIIQKALRSSPSTFTKSSI